MTKHIQLQKYENRKKSEIKKKSPERGALKTILLIKYVKAHKDTLGPFPRAKLHQTHLVSKAFTSCQ